MKKLFVLFVVLVSILCFCGCEETHSENGESSDELRVSVVINDSKKNTEEDIQIFDILSERERYANLHYKIEGEASEYDVRIRIEIRRGEDDHNIGEDFKTISDEIITKKSGKWHNEGIFIATADIYFYRVTIYQGESEKILASKTFYTPKAEPVYSEISQSAPEYRPVGFTKEEQEFYDLCSYAVLDYAKAGKYTDINDIEGYLSADGTKLYVTVIYRKQWREYLEINTSDATDYSVSYEPFDVEGLEKVLSDYYYVIEEFKNNF